MAGDRGRAISKLFGGSSFMMSLASHMQGTKSGCVIWMTSLTGVQLTAVSDTPHMDVHARAAHPAVPAVDSHCHCLGAGLRDAKLGPLLLRLDIYKGFWQGALQEYWVVLDCAERLCPCYMLTNRGGSLVQHGCHTELLLLCEGLAEACTWRCGTPGCEFRCRAGQVMSDCQ